MASKYTLLKSSAPTTYATYQNSGKAPATTLVSLRNLYGAIENQGAEGACSAFSVLQFRGALRKQAGLSWLDPSEQAQYYEERNLEGTINQDAGGTLEDALSILETLGVMHEEDDPYNQQDFTVDPPDNKWDASYKLDPSQVQAVNPFRLLADTLDAINNGHPVFFGFVVFAELESSQVAQNGILTMPTNPTKSLGGHAVNAIGDDPVNKRILVLNQWGEDWGIHSPSDLAGCFWMPYEYYNAYCMGAYVGFPDKINLVSSGLKPAMTWIGSPNFNAGRSGNKVIAITDHIMDGTLAGTDSWFQNPSSQVSAHFGIGKDGSIHQYVDINNKAWANGAVNKPNWPLLISGVNPNLYTVSIEHEGYTGDTLTEAQYQSSLALHKWLCAEFNIALGPDTIIGHNRIDSVNRANCPGPGFPWARLFNDLGESDFEMDHAVVYFTDRDFSSARMIADKLGCCAMYCRNGSNTFVHPDWAKIKHIVVVGGTFDINTATSTNCCGVHAEDTAILAANYAKTL